MSGLRTGLRVTNGCLVRRRRPPSNRRGFGGGLRNSHSVNTLPISKLTVQARLPISPRSKCFSSNTLEMGHEYVVSYTPPEWAKHLKDAPIRKLQLTCSPTPIHRWHLPGLPNDVEVYIKRDDMTGSTLSGNKIRKLEFLLADALSRGCHHIITCGGVQSNHCRAVAIACAQLGLKAHLLLRGEIQDLEAIDNVGNVFLDRLSGAELYFVPRKSPYATHLKSRMQALADTIEKSSGEMSYLVPVGGSNVVGIWGYLSAFQELTQQDVAERFDDIVFACGSGGTAEGLAFGNHLSQSGLKIHGIAVSDDAHYFHSCMNDMIDHFGLYPLRSEQILDVVEGYKGLGYGISQEKELDFVAEVARKTGIMTDPVYTGKAVYGLVQELQTNRERFKGNKILFIHTGGVFGMYDGTLQDWLKVDALSRSRMHIWPDVSDPVPAQ